MVRPHRGIIDPSGRSVQPPHLQKVHRAVIAKAKLTHRGVLRPEGVTRDDLGHLPSGGAGESDLGADRREAVALLSQSYTDPVMRRRKVVSKPLSQLQPTPHALTILRTASSILREHDASFARRLE